VPARWQRGLHLLIALFFVGLALSQIKTLDAG